MRTAKEIEVEGETAQRWTRFFFNTAEAKDNRIGTLWNELNISAR